MERGSVKYYLKVRRSDQTTANAWIEDVFIHPDDEYQDIQQHAKELIKKHNRENPQEKRRIVYARLTLPKPNGGNPTALAYKYDKV